MENEHVMAELSFTVPIASVPAGQVAMVAVVYQDQSDGHAYVAVPSTHHCTTAFCALAAALKDDEEAPYHVRHLARGVFAVLHEDVPTERGPG